MAKFVEAQTRARYQVLDGARHRYLARAGEGGEVGADVSGDAIVVGAHNLAFAGADLEVQPINSPQRSIILYQIAAADGGHFVHAGSITKP